MLARLKRKAAGDPNDLEFDARVPHIHLCRFDDRKMSEAILPFNLIQEDSWRKNIKQCALSIGKLPPGGLPINST